MKKLIIISSMFLFVGCWDFESTETRVIVGEEGAPTRIIMKLINFSSDAEEDDKIKKDFDEFVEAFMGDSFLTEWGKGTAVKDREIYIENDQVIAKFELVTKKLDEELKFIVANGERIVVFDEEFFGGDSLIETNGKIFKTEENTLIVWSEDEKELFWKTTGEEPKSETFFNNVPKIASIYRDWKKQRMK